jgi:hypothetical protein
MWHLEIPNLYCYEKCYTYQNFSPKVSSQIMCHHPMKFIILGNVSPTHGMMTHYLGTNFWRKNLGSAALLVCYMLCRWAWKLFLNCTPVKYYPHQTGLGQSRLPLVSISLASPRNVATTYGNKHSLNVLQTDEYTLLHFLIGTNWWIYKTTMIGSRIWIRNAIRLTNPITTMFYLTFCK